MNKDLFSILNQYRSLYFISPHLDDAIFSCGGLIYELKKKTNINIKVINVFTDFDDKNYSKEGLIFLRKTGFKSFSELYKKRLLEDKNIFNELKIEFFNLGFKEFIFQKISLKDYLKNKKLKKDIFKKINNFINDKNGLIFIPYGIGDHIDHLLIKKILENKVKNIIYYLEWPYLLYFYSKIKKINHSYKIFEFKKNLFIKESLVNYYDSQIKVFLEDRPNKPILLLKERYIFKNVKK